LIYRKRGLNRKTERFEACRKIFLLTGRIANELLLLEKYNLRYELSRKLITHLKMCINSRKQFTRFNKEQACNFKNY